MLSVPDLIAIISPLMGILFLLTFINTALCRIANAEERRNEIAEESNKLFEKSIPASYRISDSN